MRVVNHAIDHGSQMFRDRDNQSPWWKFLGSQMHGATRADMHCWIPNPAQRFHDSFDGSLVDAGRRVAYAALSRACALVGCCAVHEIIDLLIGKTYCDGNRSRNAIAIS